MGDARITENPHHSSPSSPTSRPILEHPVTKCTESVCRATLQLSGQLRYSQPKSAAPPCEACPALPCLTHCETLSTQGGGCRFPAAAGQPAPPERLAGPPGELHPHTDSQHPGRRGDCGRRGEHGAPGAPAPPGSGWRQPPTPRRCRGQHRSWGRRCRGAPRQPRWRRP
jgi:hypothetical protein